MKNYSFFELCPAIYWTRSKLSARITVRVAKLKILFSRIFQDFLEFSGIFQNFSLVTLITVGCLFSRHQLGQISEAQSSHAIWTFDRQSSQTKILEKNVENPKNSQVILGNPRTSQIILKNPRKPQKIFECPRKYQKSQKLLENPILGSPRKSQKVSFSVWLLY